MARILSLETATEVCSVAVHDAGILLATNEVHIGQSSASKLALLIEDVLAAANCTPSMLQAVAVSSGPGSYTGLRIGVSTGKGLCFGLDIPLIGIETLPLLAFQAKEYNTSKGYLCPMIDARRMEVYCMLTGPELEPMQPVEPKVIDADSFQHVLSKREVLFFGNGAAKCQSVITHPNARFIEGIYPKAAAMGMLAYARWNQHEFEDIAQFEPYYLKEFVAKKARPLV